MAILTPAEDTDLSSVSKTLQMPGLGKFIQFADTATL